MASTYWIGDDKDNKCVKIGSKLFGRGDVIPAEDVAEDVLAGWLEKGLISVGDMAAPVIIKDTESIKNLEAEIRILKADLERLPGLQREIQVLKKDLLKSKDGVKAKRAKELEAKVEGLERMGNEALDKIKELEVDVQEKAALIEKLNKEILDLKEPGKQS